MKVATIKRIKMTDSEKIAMLREFLERYVDYNEDTAIQNDFDLNKSRGLWPSMYRNAKEILKKTA